MHEYTTRQKRVRDKTIVSNTSTSTDWSSTWLVYSFFIKPISQQSVSLRSNILSSALLEGFPL